jgi:hypothetical protein
MEEEEKEEGGRSYRLHPRFSHSVNFVSVNSILVNLPGQVQGRAVLGVDHGGAARLRAAESGVGGGQRHQTFRGSVQTILLQAVRGDEGQHVLSG